MKHVFFDKIIAVRLKGEIWKEVQLKTIKNQDVYDNESHFIRCAIIRELRREIRPENKSDKQGGKKNGTRKH